MVVVEVPYCGGMDCEEKRLEPGHASGKGGHDARHFVQFCEWRWLPCVCGVASKRPVVLRRKPVSLSHRSASPLTRIRIRATSKAEGTEGEAESRLLRKLLKNQNRLIDSIRQMDVDRNGVISTAEFRAAVVAMNVGVTDRQVEKLIRSIDVDNDGELDMQV